ncbi:MAG: GNAT family N-acetyltransferase [Deinococcus sp.]
MSDLTRAERAETAHLALYAVEAGEVGRFGEVRAVYAGSGDLPVNVASGFGSGPSSVDALEGIEEFYAGHGLPPRVVLYSHAHPALLAALAERGYALQRLLHVHALRLDEPPFPSPGPTSPPPVRPATPAEFRATASAAFGPGSEAIMGLTSRRPGTGLWVCELGGRAVAAGAISVLGGVAVLFSAATLSSFRERGAQTALLAARLGAARKVGAELAAVLTTPGSPSERNVARAGFRQVGTRLSFGQSETERR